MDCQLPNMDGLKHAAHPPPDSRSRHQVPVIAMTAHAMAGDGGEVPGERMKRLLTKRSNKHPERNVGEMAGCAAGGDGRRGGGCGARQSGAPGGVVSPGVQTHQISVRRGSLPTLQESHSTPTRTTLPAGSKRSKKAHVRLAMESPARPVCLTERPANRRFRQRRHQFVALGMGCSSVGRIPIL